MFIVRVNGKDTARDKVLKNAIRKAQAVNNTEVDVEIWGREIIPQKGYRKNGRVRNGGFDCERRIRYLNSPVGVEKLKLNLTPKEKEQWKQQLQKKSA